MGNTVADVFICSADNLLHVFLHGGNGEDTGHGGELEEIRSVYPGDKARATDSGLYRRGADAAGECGFVVPSVYRGVTEFDRRSDAYPRGILWRDGVIDSGKCSIAYDEADRSDGSNEALRRVYALGARLGDYKIKR